jgi:hypothetical protein
MHAACAHAAGPSRRVHLELFAHGFVVVIPARIGVRSARCRAHEWTTTPTGVVLFDRAATLGDLFSVWGEPLGRRRLLSFHGAVSFFRNGIRVRGDPRSVALRDGDELVLETGPYVPPHSSFVFPPH